MITSTGRILMTSREAYQVMKMISGHLRELRSRIAKAIGTADLWGPEVSNFIDSEEWPATARDGCSVYVRESRKQYQIAITMIDRLYACRKALRKR